MPAALKASIVHLGRNCDGENRRVESWQKLFEKLGFEVTRVPLIRLHRRTGWSQLADNNQLDPYVPEARLWNEVSLMEQLRETRPDYVVGVTTRCWHPRLNEGDWKLVLDFVDTMSVNYEIRADLASLKLRPLFRFLSNAHKKAELRAAEDFPDATFVHAGYSEASKRGTVWIPNVIPDETFEQAPPTKSPANDLVFFGALYTPINLDAVAALDKAADTTLAGINVMLAGRKPTKHVEKTAVKHGWRLAADFPNLQWLRNHARVAVAPLGPSTGIQNKVIDAAVAGIPQTLTAPVLKGFKPGFPVKGSMNQPQAIVDAVQLLNEDPLDLHAAAQETRQYVISNYGAKRWADALAGVLEVPYRSERVVGKKTESARTLV